MTGKRQKKHYHNAPREGATSHPSPQEAGTTPEPHSAPATPTRPSILASGSARGAKGTKSTPLLGEVGSSSNAKVAIPRQPPGDAPRYHRRVPRACESCRQRKSKCSGDTPICRQCREMKLPCEYPVGWKEKMKLWAPFYTDLGS